MEKQKIDSLVHSELSIDAQHKIQLQANYLGLQNNYVNGEKVQILIKEKVYEVEFNREDALKQNMPLGCGSKHAMGFLDEFQVGNSKEGREKLADLLGISKVDEKVFNAVVHDSTYFHNLLVSREIPSFISSLLNNPPEWQGIDENVEVNRKTTSQLISKVARSMIDWSKSGFSKVDDLTYQRRINACMNCKFFKDPPDTLAYKFAVLSKDEKLGKKICGMCGCLVASKARLPHEFCPSNHDEIEGMTKWGEAVR